MANKIILEANLRVPMQMFVEHLRTFDRDSLADILEKNKRLPLVVRFLRSAA